MFCIAVVLSLIGGPCKKGKYPALRFEQGRSGGRRSVHRKQFGSGIQNEKEALEHIIRQMEAERSWTGQQRLLTCGLLLLKKICRETVMKPKESKEHARECEK